MRPLPAGQPNGLYGVILGNSSVCRSAEALVAGIIVTAVAESC